MGRLWHFSLHLRQKGLKHIIVLLIVICFHTIWKWGQIKLAWELLLSALKAIYSITANNNKTQQMCFTLVDLPGSSLNSSPPKKSDSLAAWKSALTCALLLKHLSYSRIISSSDMEMMPSRPERTLLELTAFSWNRDGFSNSNTNVAFYWWNQPAGLRGASW